MNTPPKKEKSISYWKNRCDKAMSQLVRDKGFCEHCGSSTNQLQHNHVIGRGNQTLRYDIINGMCLCARCHLWWHHEPVESGIWFKEKFPERYEYLMKARDTYTKRKIADYKSVLEHIENKDIRKLILDIS